MKELKAILINLSLFCASALIMIIMAEALLRINYHKYTHEHPRLFRYEKNLGWEFVLCIKAKGAQVIDNGYNGIVSINSAGFRDKERSMRKPAGKKRIAVIGDSFVSNIDVAADKVFTEVMENELLPPVSNYEVLNFAVNGYGPLQELLLLKTKVVEYKPDIVVAVVYIGNDFNDICGTYEWIEGYCRPKAKILQGGDMLIIPPETRSAIKTTQADTKRSVFNIENSYLLARLQRLQHFYYATQVFQKPPEMELFLKKVNRETDERFILMRRIIKEMRDVSADNNAQFILVVMPTLYQAVEEKTWEKLLKKWHLETSDYDRMLPNTFIEQTARQLDIKFLDLTHILKQNPKSFTGNYHIKNQHLSNKGNRLVAEAITQYLMMNNL